MMSKNNKSIDINHLDLLNDYSIINPIMDTHYNSEIKALKKYPTPRKNNAATSNSVFQFLSGHNDVVDFLELYQSEKREQFDHSYPAIAEHLDEILQLNAEQRFPISKDRIRAGFAVGVVDFISGSLTHTRGGWLNEKGHLALPPDATLNDIGKYVKSETYTAPELSVRDLKQAENEGKLYIGGKLAAEKVEYLGALMWQDKESEKLFNEGDLIRLLHHRNETFCFANTNLKGNEYFHANLSDKPEPVTDIKFREGVSRQGDGFYSTSSLNEAVKIYGNPHSVESKGKLLHIRENEKQDTTNHNKGHLYSVSTDAKVFVASIESTNLTAHTIPSLPLTLGLAKKYGANTTFATNKWLEMKDSTSTYELYCHLNELNQAAQRASGKNSFMTDTLKAMGFEGIEIVFPQSEIDNYKEKLTEISNLPEDFFRENKVRKENILEAVKGFIDNFESGIPTKAEMSHLIVFNPNKIQKEFLLTLPKAPEPERDERFTPIKKGLYWSDKKVTMDDLTKKEMSFDHSTEMTM